MKSITIIFFLNLFTTQLFSQDLTKDTIIGTWKVIDSQILVEMKGNSNAEGKKKVEQMKKGFIGSIFKFKANNKFSIKFPANIPKFMKEMEFLNNKKWKIENGERISIVDDKTGSLMLDIIVKISKGKKYFILDQTPLLLEVIQQSE